MTLFEKVKKFTKASADCKATPQAMTHTEFAFLKRMIQDELKEVEDAFNSDSDLLVEQLDGCIDIIYYIMNAVAKTGSDLDPLLDIVCEANNSKIVDGKVLRDEDPESPRYGKILKPEGWQEPQPLLVAELNRQMAQSISISDMNFDPDNLLKSVKEKHDGSN